MTEIKIKDEKSKKIKEEIWNKTNAKETKLCLKNIKSEVKSEVKKIKAENALHLKKIESEIKNELKKIKAENALYAKEIESESKIMIETSSYAIKFSGFTTIIISLGMTVIVAMLGIFSNSETNFSFWKIIVLVILIFMGAACLIMLGSYFLKKIQKIKPW